MNWTALRIFRKGSKTYFYSSLFFPARVRRDVFALYAFVREADNYVDAVPQQIKEFHLFKERYHRLRQSPKSDYDPVISPFVELSQRKNFDPFWINAFFHSMELDTYKNEYNSLAETLEYIYGSAEVIGLMMCRILDLDEQSFPFAQAQGRAMQYINFIRDIQEDNRLGRRYLPLTPKHQTQDLHFETIQKRQQYFVQWLHNEIQRYFTWQNEAEKGYQYIPRRYLIPIKTASDLYQWTARQIEAAPTVVYQHKVKPSLGIIGKKLITNTFLILIHNKYHANTPKTP